jgi:hypothetical protein
MRKLCKELEAQLHASVVTSEELKSSSAIELASTQEAARELAGIVIAQHKDELAAAATLVTILSMELEEQGKQIAELVKQGAEDMAEVLQGLRAAEAEIERLQATNLASEEAGTALKFARKDAVEFEEAAKDAAGVEAMTVAAPRSQSSASCCRRFLVLFILLIIGIVASGLLVRRVRNHLMVPYASGSNAEFWHRVQLAVDLVPNTKLDF